MANANLNFALIHKIADQMLVTPLPSYVLNAVQPYSAQKASTVMRVSRANLLAKTTLLARSKIPATLLQTNVSSKRAS
jgi:hypothetical protein